MKVVGQIESPYERTTVEEIKSESKESRNLVEVVKVAIDVHGCPGQHIDAWSQFVANVCKMTHQHGLQGRPYQLCDALVLLQ